MIKKKREGHRELSVFEIIGSQKREMRGIIQDWHCVRVRACQTLETAFQILRSDVLHNKFFSIAQVLCYSSLSLYCTNPLKNPAH